MNIIIKTEPEIAIMRQAGRIVAEVLEELKNKLEVGMKTRELDKIAADGLNERGARPSFLGYRGFPASLCVSINEEVVHGIPGERTIKEGDIVSLDLGAIYKGYQGDAAISVIAGKGSRQGKDLVVTTRDSLSAGIAAARSGGRLGDISAAIQNYVESRGYSVVREYTGHGIGCKMHEDPQVFNFGTAGHGVPLEKGMVLALEPMVNSGDWRTRVGDDNWVVLTVDGGLSAHFEHTIAITDGEPEVLTAL